MEFSTGDVSRKKNLGFWLVVVDDDDSVILMLLTVSFLGMVNELPRNEINLDESALDRTAPTIFLSAF